MANALISRQSLVALKTESTAGTAETLANADAAINCYDASYTPDIPMIERPGQGTYDANLESIPGARMGRISFRTDAFGASSSALWFARMLVHAGFSISSSTATAVGSANVSAATVSVYVDGMEHSLAGAVISSLQIDFERGAPMFWSAEYVGKYAAPTDTALLTPTYPVNVPDRFASGNLTLAGSAVPTFSGSIRIENQVAMRPDPTDATGYLHAQITRQTITAELNTEADLVANRPDLALLLARTEMDLVLTSDASLTVTVPNAQRVNVQNTDNEGIFSRTLSLLHTDSTAATIGV